MAICILFYYFPIRGRSLFCELRLVITFCREVYFGAIFLAMQWARISFKLFEVFCIFDNMVDKHLFCDAVFILKICLEIVDVLGPLFNSN